IPRTLRNGNVVGADLANGIVQVTSNRVHDLRQLDRPRNMVDEIDEHTQLVCNWAMIERHTNCLNFPLDRCRWVMDGAVLDICDRPRRAARRPMFDSPTARGLFDPTTGVYWAVDTFATPVPDPQLGVADLDADFWDYGLALFALGGVSPWLSMVDEAKYGRSVDGVQSLDITTVACCHSPVIEGRFIDRAFARIRELPSLPPIPLPDQSVLDQIVAASAQPQTEPSAV